MAEQKSQKGANGIIHRRGDCVVSYLFSSQTTTYLLEVRNLELLYPISFHHQTTTYIMYYPYNNGFGKHFIYKKWRDEHQILCKDTKKIPTEPAFSVLSVLSLPKCLLFPNTAYLLS